MTIIVGDAAQFRNNFALMNIDHACTISAMLVDYITDGQVNFFSSRQWLANVGLADVSLKLGIEIELANSANLQEISKTDNSLPTWENFVKFVVTINDLDDKEIYRHEEEYVVVPENGVGNALLLAATQFSGNCDALLSYERFLTFATHKNPVSYKGKKIFISGCGTGAEAIVCKALGAACILGFDIDQSAIEFAINRFRGVDNVNFTSCLPNELDEFDLVISRHVLEHVPRKEWGAYFSELSSLLRINGEILLDVPNQNNPREPHTDILFFHLLSEETKARIVEYCEETKPSWYEPFKVKMNTLISHRNVELREIILALPSNLVVEKIEFIDTNCESYNQDNADGIRVLLKKATL